MHPTRPTPITRLVLTLSLIGACACACGGDSGSPDVGTTLPDAAEHGDDAGLNARSDVDQGSSADTGADLWSFDAGVDAARGDADLPTEVLVDANIDEVLACATPGAVRGQTVAGHLQLHEVDISAFPDALCNDGTPAVLYFRPYRGASNRNRWVISLRGGGGCGAGQECAARWCGCGNPGAPPCPYTEISTNFNANNMSGGGARARDGAGVQRRDGASNPFADFNHVQLIYCSSDQWAGNVRGLSYTVPHPRTGAEVTYRLHFLGAQILAADLATLRQDGVPALTYTADGGATPMPDLDDAEAVVFVGDSAGGAGVIHNLDAMQELLRDNNSSGGALPEVVGIIDAVVGPDLSRLDWTNTPLAGAGITTYEAAMAAQAASPANENRFTDASCVDWHRANRPGTEAQCGDMSHVVRHHVTTPFFIRMALLDSLISRVYADFGVADPILGPFDFVGPMNNIPMVFAQVLHDELEQFPNLPATAEEGTDMPTAPGVFAPACFRHDTIHHDGEVFGTSIDPTGTQPTRFFGAFANWRAGTPPTAVLTEDPMRQDTICSD